MPWKECDAVDLRREAVELASQPEANVSEVARRFGVSRRTVYKWQERWRACGEAGLEDRSRRPRSSPRRTRQSIERCVIELRREHPTWGGRKIARVLENRGCKGVPAPSTVTGILRRHGLIDAAASDKSTPWQRFERSEPNDLQQMDFKGHFALEDGRRCHPLTILDDHSRYSLAVRALPNERGVTVRKELVRVFETYGLPRQMLTDNGPPWGDDVQSRHTKLTVWLIEHGVEVIHGRPLHPQTQGKLERLHRTLNADVIAGRSYRSLVECQRAFDEWRATYNHKRPHEALDLHVPAHRYRLSRRTFQEKVLAWDYPPGVAVRRVDGNGRLSYRGMVCKIGKPFIGKSVGIEPTTEDSVFDVKFRHQRITSLDMGPR